MDTTPGLPLLLITLLLGFAAGVALFVAVASGNRRRVIVLVRGMVIWCAAYGIILLTTSLSSQDRLLGHGQRKTFCGFYLDCHLGARVLHADRVSRLVFGDSVVTTPGEFVLVDLAVDNHARMRTLQTQRINAVAQNDEGRVYPRRPDLEFEINARFGRPSTLEAAVNASRDVRRILVFEVPEGTPGLKMHVSRGNPIERLLELFLIGDEDSLLHGRSYFRV